MTRKRAPEAGLSPPQEYQPMVDERAAHVYDQPMSQHSYQPNAATSAESGPDWPGLRLLAAGQAGHFTAAQAQALRFSEQLLSKHTAAGKFHRPQRGIYRFAEFAQPGRPRSEVERADDDLVVAWLWSETRGVISHESALQLHNLSDALPARIHITLPPADRPRRRTVPPLYVLHFSDVPRDDLAWMGPIPVTTPARTLRDVAEAHGDAGLLSQAAEQGVHRNLFTPGEIAGALSYAASFAMPGWRVYPEAVEGLGNQWTMHAFSGTCRTAPPSDWPGVACEAVEAHDGRVYYQSYHPESRTLMLHVVWPLGTKNEAGFSALRDELARRFGWR